MCGKGTKKILYTQVHMHNYCKKVRFFLKKSLIKAPDSHFSNKNYYLCAVFLLYWLLILILLLVCDNIIYIISRM